MKPFPVFDHVFQELKAHTSLDLYTRIANPVTLRIKAPLEEVSPCLTYSKVEVQAPCEGEIVSLRLLEATIKTDPYNKNGPLHVTFKVA